MKPLDEIIQSVTEADEPVARTLRRCLVLAFTLKNESLKTWVEKELNGYGQGDELPDYRKAFGTAKGLFLGGFGRELRDQPLPPSVLNKEHRHFAEEIRLTQPIAAYDGGSGKSAMLQSPADLVAHYQESFIDGMALNRAWMEIPGSTITGLVDTVRTRVLTFALQIREEIADDANESIEAIPPAIVERIVNVTIFGGNNVVGDVQEFTAPTVVTGDIQSLKNALSHIGVTGTEFGELEARLNEDGTHAAEEGAKKSLGKRTTEWVIKTAKKLGTAGVKIGGEVVEEVVKRAVMSYLGLKP